MVGDVSHGLKSHSAGSFAPIFPANDPGRFRVGAYQSNLARSVNMHTRGAGDTMMKLRFVFGPPLALAIALAPVSLSVDGSDLKIVAAKSYAESGSGSSGSGSSGSGSSGSGSSGSGSSGSGSSGSGSSGSGSSGSGSGGSGSGGSGSSHGGTSGSGGGHDDHGGDDRGRNGDDDGGRHGAEHVNSAGQKVERRGNNIEVVHASGIKEEIEGGVYEMKDAKGRTIVERRATSADIARLSGFLR